MTTKSYSALKLSILFIVSTCYILLYFKNFWVSDDAYISFRSIEQLFDGNGPRWNAHERVQSFTSPLWFWILSFTRLFNESLYFNVLGIGVIWILAFLGILWKITKDPILWATACLFFLSSQAFFDYTASGLENNFAYFLLILFVLSFHNLLKSPALIYGYVYLWVLASLLVLTRHDLSLLVAPMGIYSFFSGIKFIGWRKSVLLMLLCSSPFWSWSIFSFFYYGSIFPNTAYAKLDTGIARYDLVVQSLRYFESSLRYDVITLPVIFLATVLGIVKRRNTFLLLLSVAILSNLLYVVYIGGDFMRGRFFSFSYVYAVVILVVLIRDYVSQIPLYFLALVLLIYLFVYPYTAVELDPNSGKGTMFDYVTGQQIGEDPFLQAVVDESSGVFNEKLFYFHLTSLWNYFDTKTKTNYPIESIANMFEEFSGPNWREDYFEPDILVTGSIGFLGYLAPTEKIIIDFYALGDPFLAQLPVRDVKNWRIGHFERAVPEDYINSIRSGVNQFHDPELRRLYQRTQILTQSEPLLSLERLRVLFFKSN